MVYFSSIICCLNIMKEVIFSYFNLSRHHASALCLLQSEVKTTQMLLKLCDYMASLEL
jgi:hypothetical protein